MSQSQNAKATVTAFKDPDAQSFIRNVLSVLGSPPVETAFGSCDIQGIVLSGGIQTSTEWISEPQNFRVIFHGANGDHSVNGSDGVSEGSKTVFPSQRFRESYFIPAAATQWLERLLVQSYTGISNVTAATIEGKQYKAIRFLDMRDNIFVAASEQTWYFDPDTLVPRRVLYEIASPTRTGPGLPAHVTFDSFAKFGPTLFPQKFSTFVGKDLRATVTINQVSCKPDPHPSTFFSQSSKEAK